MNEFEFSFNDYRYGAIAVARKYRKQMNKNESIEIKSLQNGYLVERSWREASGESTFEWRYVDEKFVFLTWDEVVKFVTENKLDVPPAKLN